MKLILKILIILISTLVLVYSCVGTSTPDNQRNLTLTNSYTLPIMEASGLTLSKDNVNLWTVDDQKGGIYLIDKSGKEIKQMSIDEIDIEGITVFDDSLLAVVLERSRKIIILDYEGNIKKKIKTGLSGEDNSGLEGITYLSEENSFLIANEKTPSMLIKILIEGDIVQQDTINFLKDISGLFYDNNKNQLWILSEESHTIYRCSTNFDILESFEVPDNKLEGIAVLDDIIYLVSDSFGILYEYKLN